MYQKIHKLIGSSFKKSFYLSWILSFISSLFEIFSIAILSFYVSLILDFDLITNLNEFKFLKNFFDFQKYDQFETFILFSIFLCFFVLIKNLYLVFVIFYENYIIYKIKLANGSKLFNKYINSPYSFFIKSNPSTFIRNLSGELDRSHLFILQYFTIIREILLTLFIFGLLSYSNLFITLIALIIIIIFVVIYYFSFRKILTKKGILTQSIEEKLMSVIHSTFNSIKVIKIFKIEEIYKNDHFNKLKQHGLSGLYPNLISKLPRYILEIVVITIMVSVILLLNRYNENFQDNISLISIFAISALRLIPAFTLIASCVSSIKNLEPSFKNFVSEISNDNEDNKFENIEQEKFSKKIKFETPKSIRFENVNFTYDDNNKFTLKNINLEIKKNSICGIVGESGSGKSTIVDILLGLLKPNSGKILFDEKIIDYKTLFNNKVFGYVPQNIYLNEGSIKENIAFGVDKNEIDESKIKKLLKFVNLYDYVSGLKDYIDTKVNYLGSNFSGGQVQRLGIARSLYYDPKFVILDEATNSLDPQNEKMLLKELKSMKTEVTFIVISHRDSTISACDTVYKIKNGLINEN
mgnify:CR=1 FL=1